MHQSLSVALVTAAWGADGLILSGLGKQYYGRREGAA